MLNNRIAVRLGEEQLQSLILAISHLIEQQYALKLSDNQFGILEAILEEVYTRGRNSSLVPWHSSFKYSATSVDVGDMIAATVISKGSGKINTEFFPQDPAGPLNAFVDYLIEKAEVRDSSGVPLIFLGMSEEQKKAFKHRVESILKLPYTIEQKDALKELAKIC